MWHNRGRAKSGNTYAIPTLSEGLLSHRASSWCLAGTSEYFQDEGYGYCEGDIDSPIGAEIEIQVTAETFEELMEKIDEAGIELLKSESENSKQFQEFIEYRTEGYRNPSDKG